MADSVPDSMAGHLEFLGYEITKDAEKKLFRAKHPRHPNLRVREFGGGVCRLRPFGAETRPPRATGFLRAINALNEKAVVARFYTDHDNSDLGFFVEAWQPSLYDKCKFGEFLDVLQHDFQLLGDEEVDIKKYLA